MGKGGNSLATAVATSSKASTDALELLIDGTYYDVTDFTKKHPGGGVIKFYAGKDIDASQAFANFHVRSKSAKIILNSLKKRTASSKEIKDVNAVQGQNELLNDFNELTKELEAEGYFKPSIPHVVKRCLEIFLMHAIGFYFLFNGSTTLYQAIGIVILGVVCGRCGWLMHEGGHYSLTGNIKIDRALQIFFYGVGCGMSGSWWRSQHNRHHSMPQKLGHDVDLETLPLVAFTSRVAKRVGFPMKVWLRMQAFMFPVITTLLVALGWQFYLHPSHVIRKRNYAEMLAISMRYILWSLFVTPRFGLFNSIGLYLAYTHVAANSIFINFAVSHTHLPTVDKDDTNVDWVRYAVIHTMNVKAGPLKCIDWWMSYLNYQIEHHLFPSMPQFRHPMVSKRVKAMCMKHGLVYDQRDYITALKVTFENLEHTGSDIYLG